MKKATLTCNVCNEDVSDTKLTHECPKERSMKILETNECDLGCDCGWNITIGGTDEEDLKALKEFVNNK